MDAFEFDNRLILLPIIIAIALAERVWPKATRPTGSGRLISNLSLATFNGLLSPVIVLPITVWAASIAPSWRPHILEGWVGVVLDILLLDLWIYWWHRANHRVPFLWRFHEVHHLDEFLDVTSAVRFHFGEIILSAFVRAIPIILLDINISSVLIFTSLVLLSTIFHHSNISLPAFVERCLRLFIVTPSHHWVHHHKIRRDTDSNYSTILTIWDRLFRSWSSTSRWKDMPIGTEGRHEKSLPGLITRPLNAP